MRTLALLTLTAALACGEAKETVGERPSSAEAATPVAGEENTDAPKAAVEEPKPALLDCDSWLSADLLKTHCGVDLPLIDNGKSVQTPDLCTRVAEGDGGGRVSVSLERLIGGTMGPTVRRLYPDPPELVKQGRGTIVKGRKFPYLLTVDPATYLSDSLCSDEQALALAKAIAAAIPGGEEPASRENNACDALLTSADIKAKCGHEGTVNASMMEDGKSLFCNRAGSGLIFIVSKHSTEDQAKRGAEVAREDASAGVAHKGPYSIELKTAVGGDDACSKEGLDALAKLVADRL